MAAFRMVQHRPERRFGSGSGDTRHSRYSYTWADAQVMLSPLGGSGYPSFATKARDTVAANDLRHSKRQRVFMSPDAAHPEWLHYP